jgi:aryl-alcohol dehydrogenase-like predicted oxidoreductase
MSPIPGPTRVETVRDSLTATSVELSDEQFERIQANLPKQVEESDELYPKPPYRDTINA